MSPKTTVSRGGPTRQPASWLRSASGRTEGPPPQRCELVPPVLLWPLPALAGSQQLTNLALCRVPWQASAPTRTRTSREGLPQTRSRPRPAYGVRVYQSLENGHSMIQYGGGERTRTADFYDAKVRFSVH